MATIEQEIKDLEAELDFGPTESKLFATVLRSTAVKPGCDAITIERHRNALVNYRDGGRSTAKAAGAVGPLDLYGPSAEAALTGKPVAAVVAERDADKEAVKRKVRDLRASLDRSEAAVAAAHAERDAALKQVADTKASMAPTMAKIGRLEAAITAEGLFSLTEENGAPKVGLTQAGLARFVNAAAVQTIASFGHAPLAIGGAAGAGMDRNPHASGKSARQRAADATTQNLIERGLVQADGKPI